MGRFLCWVAHLDGAGGDSHPQLETAAEHLDLVEGRRMKGHGRQAEWSPMAQMTVTSWWFYESRGPGQACV